MNKNSRIVIIIFSISGYFAFSLIEWAIYKDSALFALGVSGIVVGGIFLYLALDCYKKENYVNGKPHPVGLAMLILAGFFAIGSICEIIGYFLAR